MSISYEQIYDAICDRLTPERVSSLRRMLRSMLSDAELTEFCRDKSKLALADFKHGIEQKGPVREFRGCVFSVRLYITVETDTADNEVDQISIRVEVRDGSRSFDSKL
jgi:hypothetical protein